MQKRRLFFVVFSVVGVVVEIALNVDDGGTLCDLTSGSGDKGTPIILIQGYFDNFAV